MGKHNIKNGVTQTRSRNAQKGEAAENNGSKGWRRPRERLEKRRKFFDEVMTRSTRYNPSSPCYHRPGSMKARTN